MEIMYKDNQCFVKRSRESASSMYCSKLVDDVLVTVRIIS